MGTVVIIIVAPGTAVAPVLILPAIAARTASPINGAAENDNHIYMTIIIITFYLTKRLVYNLYYIFLKIAYLHICTVESVYLEVDGTVEKFRLIRNST